jgi:hypothetical protein
MNFVIKKKNGGLTVIIEDTLLYYYMKTVYGLFCVGQDGEDLGHDGITSTKKRPVAQLPRWSNPAQAGPGHRVGQLPGPQVYEGFRT